MRRGRGRLDTEKRVGTVLGTVTAFVTSLPQFLDFVTFPEGTGSFHGKMLALRCLEEVHALGELAGDVHLDSATCC